MLHRRTGYLAKTVEALRVLRLDRRSPKGLPGASLIALTASALLACGGSPTPPGMPAPPSRQQLTTATFTITYTQSEATSISAIADLAEASVPRVREALGVTQPAQVRVSYYETHAELAAAVRPFVGAIPSWATGLVTSGQDIHLLSAGAAGSGQIAQAATLLVHEFAHCVTLQLDQASGNNPRWLWETIAIYLAGQFRQPSSVAALRDGQAPALSVLNVFDNNVVYDVGFLLGEFIVERGGTAALRQLVLARGNTTTVLGLSETEFVSEWRTWIRARHGI